MAISPDRVTIPRAVLQALLDEYRNDVRSEWSSEVSRTHDPEYFAVLDAMQTEQPQEGPADDARTARVLPAGI